AGEHRRRQALAVLEREDRDADDAARRGRESDFARERPALGCVGLVDGHEVAAAAPSDAAPDRSHSDDAAALAREERRGAARRHARRRDEDRGAQPPQLDSGRRPHRLDPRRARGDPVGAGRSPHPRGLMHRLAAVAPALVALGVARLVPADGSFGLWLRLVTATAVLLVPGRLVALALGQPTASAALGWSCAAVAGALAVTFAVHASLWLTLALVGTVALAALPFARREREPSVASGLVLLAGL